MYHYAELVCQTNFSFLTGASHPEEYIKQAHFLGYSALAITDECSVAGVVKAHQLIKDQGLSIKLIIGSLFHFEDEMSLVLLCPNQSAYAELCRIITNARRRSPKGHYQLDLWDLRSSRHCLVIWLPKGDHTIDTKWAEWLTAHYKQRLWIGCQRHLVANEHRYIAHCKNLSHFHHIPITACGGVLFHAPQRLMLQHTLTAIRLGKPIHQLGRALLSNQERALRPIKKLVRLYPKDWLDAATYIAQQCHFNLQSLCYRYPAELVPKGLTPTAQLRALVKQGMAKRFADKRTLTYKLLRIIAKELKLIAHMQYEHFFLTIHDIVQFAQKRQILYQGRGSAANSVVCYCLEITAVDPRQIDVLFERFISKERSEPPDIDVDFEHQRREEIIQYIYQKYGHERAALAATVITYREKSAIREVGKALGINETQLDFFIKNINRRDKQLGWQAQLTELGLATHSHIGQHFVHLVNEIKGFPRHLSQHVGGFVIANDPLYQLVPIENASMPERSVIQWDKDDLESLGLLKVDILALGMLSAIRRSFEFVEQHYQRTLSIAQITRMGDDAKVYHMIQQADTVGVFQIESRAQMSMLPRLKPQTYYDLVIQIAIVRPGPIQGDMVHPFLKRRNKIEAVDYPSDQVKSVLERTLGVPIFQEQVIKLAMVAAGFTGGEADQLRRAMASWKKTGELAKFKEKLVKGMLERGYEQAFAERIFQQICGFGEYGFPESHSASFAVLAYVSSWLKCYYPAAFYAGLLNSWPMGFYSPAQLIQDAKRHQVTILPICINQSDYDHCLQFEHNQWCLRLGFRLIKSLSQEACSALISERPKTGFKHINEVKKVAINQAQLEALASANAFHCFDLHRYSARWQLMETETDLPLFANECDSPLYTIAPPNAFENLIEDYAAFKLTLNQHPLTLLKAANQLPNYTPAAQLHRHRHKAKVTVAGVVVGRQRPGTARGVTFMTLEDETGNVNIIVWLATSRAQKQAFLKSKLVVIDGILERGDGDVTHIIAGKINDFSHALQTLNTRSRDFH